MWSGTSLSPNDQWIELRNTTKEYINIGKWHISNLRDINKPDIMIPANSIIEANGYFLISSYPKESKNTSLNVNEDMVNSSIYLLLIDNGNLVLRDTENNIIDEVILNEDGTYPAGDINFKSMQRSLDGTYWYTCESDLCKSSYYWKDIDTINYGSPKSGNI